MNSSMSQITTWIWCTILAHGTWHMMLAWHKIHDTNITPHLYMILDLTTWLTKCIIRDRYGNREMIFDLINDGHGIENGDMMRIRDVMIVHVHWSQWWMVTDLLLVIM